MTNKNQTNTNQKTTKSKRIMGLKSLKTICRNKNIAIQRKYRINMRQKTTPTVNRQHNNSNLNTITQQTNTNNRHQKLQHLQNQKIHPLLFQTLIILKHNPFPEV
jgi:hypothetical protein